VINSILVAGTVNQKIKFNTQASTHIHALHTVKLIPSPSYV